MQVIDYIHKLNQIRNWEGGGFLMMDNNHLEDENTQSDENIQHTKNDEIKEHPFDRLMFGSRQTSNHSTEKKAGSKVSEYENLLNQINIEEIMTNIDSLVGSAKQLKPMFNKIRPIFNQFLKK